MIELQSHAVLLIRYEERDYPIVGYFMPNAVLSRRNSLPGDIKIHDQDQGLRLQAAITQTLDCIYDKVILPKDIEAIARLKYPEPPTSVVDFMKITRMFG